MRDGVGKGLQFPVGFLQLRRPLLNTDFQGLVELPNFFFRLQTAGDFGLQGSIGRCQIRGAVDHTLLQLSVQGDQLQRLAVQLDEHSHFGAKDFGDHGHKDVVHRAEFVAFEPIQVRGAPGGDENDRCLAESRVLAEQRGGLEAVHLRHHDVQQHQRDRVLEQTLQGLPARTGHEDVLAQRVQHRLVRQQFSGVVVH